MAIDSPLSAAPAPMDLSTPPQVVNQGRGTHGVLRLEDEFRLPQLWSLHLYGYHAELEVDGVSHAIAPGTVSLVPPDALIRYRYRGPSTHLFAHLRARWLGRTRAPVDRPGDGLRMIMSPGADLPVIDDLMTSAIAASTTRPTRTRANLWAALLHLDALPHTTLDRPAREHLAVAMAFVESTLPEPLSVPRIAAEVGISPNHLRRVFAAEAGETVVGYVRRRRVERARRLLASSTMTVGAIAASTGFSDLQAFNKACRIVTGLSPRAIRQQS